ncbi:hypothetical protein [Spirosoma sp. KNUC1025]|uniref:hypothetical protein n=1 Tax=Spirosoma sp. KNUC1025 TaxID=2894082 RepID=UPI00386FEF21|nr:hypothetical protein LN737_25220 [Spirosoma sp. KNUC1025]
MQHRLPWGIARSLLLSVSLLSLLTACDALRSSGPSVSRRPSYRSSVTHRTGSSAKPSANSTAAKAAGKVVDSRTYENRYVPEVVKIARTYTGTPYRSGATPWMASIVQVWFMRFSVQLA